VHVVAELQVDGGPTNLFHYFSYWTCL